MATPPDCVDVFNTGFNMTQLTAGTDPFGVAVDAAAHAVFVTNTGSNNVTVFNDTTQASVASISVGTAPLGVAYDPATDELYVANSGSNSVSVISVSTLTVVANVSVGTGPAGVDVDTASGQVFVADNGSNAVSVIRTSNHTVVATLPAGTGPLGVAVATGLGLAFVTNYGSNNVTVVNASQDFVTATIPVVGPGLDLQGIAFDPQTGSMWIGAGFWYAVVLNVSALSVGGYYATDPSGVAYDSTTGEVCLTNTGNFTFECLRSPFDAWTAAFGESGLPPGTAWTVSLGNGAQSSTTASIDVGVVPWVYGAGQVSSSYTILTAAPFLPTPASGSIGFSNFGPSTKWYNVTFAPSAGLFAVTFLESGLPPTASWSVTLNNTTVRSNASSITIYEPNGTALPFQVSPPVGYTASPATGRLTIAGAAVNVSVTFSPSVPSTSRVSFFETGLPVNSTWYLLVAGVWYGVPTATLSLSLPNGTYAFALGPLPGYVASPSSGTVAVSGVPVTVTLRFTASTTPSYLVTLSESGLPSGTPWGVTIGGTVVAGSSTAFTTQLPNGTYAYGVQVVVGYIPSVAQGTLTVAGAPATLDVVFAPAPPSLALSVSLHELVVTASCLANGNVSNVVALSAQASGGLPPYSYFWSVPSGNASGPLAYATIVVTAPVALRWVSVTVTDASGNQTSASVLPPSVLPPCPPPPPSPNFPSATPAALTTVYALVALSVVVAAVAIAAVLVVYRRKP